MTEVEAKVIRLRFGLDGEKTRTLEDIGQIFGISGERIRQIEKKVIHKLRLCIDVKKYLDYTDNPSEASKNIYAYRKKYFFEKISNIYQLNNFDYQSISWNDIESLIYKLPNEEKTIILIYFGFLNGKEYTISGICKKINLKYSSKSIKYVNEIIINFGRQIEKLKKEEKGIGKNNFNRKEGKVMGRKLRTIYEIFSSYDKDRIDKVIESLSLKEKELIRLRYSDDLDKPVKNAEFDAKHKYDFYSRLIPKIKRMLANYVSDNSKNIELENLDQADTAVKQIKEDKKEITKEEYINILSVFNNPRFINLSKTFGIKESFVLALKLGFIDGKYFSTDAIANFLDINSLEVIQITKEGLNCFKNEFNKMVDEAIESCESESTSLKKVYEQKNNK